MMTHPLPLILLALTTTHTLLASAAPYTIDDGDFPEVVPAKRAALVLDRLLVALQRVLDEPKDRLRVRADVDKPLAQPLRVAHMDDADMIAAKTWSTDDLNPIKVKSSLQRRGQSGATRGRVLRCYFNAITCF